MPPPIIGRASATTICDAKIVIFVRLIQVTNLLFLRRKSKWNRSLLVLITRLRRALSKDPRIRIVNVRGTGYKLIAEYLLLCKCRAKMKEESATSSK